MWPHENLLSPLSKLTVYWTPTDIDRKVQEERKQADAEYDRDLTILVGRLQDAPNTSAADRAGWEQEIKRLQDRIAIPIC